MSTSGKDERTDTSGQDGGGQAAPELEEIARRYLDLWQDQMTALAADPEFAQGWRKLLESMGAQAAAWQAQGLPGFPQQTGGQPDPMAVLQAMMGGIRPPAAEEKRDENAGDQGSHSGKSESEAGTAVRSAPTAAASDGGGDGLERIAARLERIEQRLAALEPKPSRNSGGSRKRNRKPGS